MKKPLNRLELFTADELCALKMALTEFNLVYSHGKWFNDVAVAAMGLEKQIEDRLNNIKKDHVNHSI